VIQKDISETCGNLKRMLVMLLLPVERKLLKEPCIGVRITFHITRRDIDISVVGIGTCRALGMVILVWALCRMRIMLHGLRQSLGQENG